MKSLLRHLHAPVYECRIRALCSLMVPHLRGSRSALDVGCGSGALGKALRDALGEGALEIEGLENRPRGNEPIPVHAYAGGRVPMADDSRDTVILADVLHHEEDPGALLREACRVARRNVIVKDHQVRGPLSQARVALLDWAANAGYGVRCLYRYPSPDGWRRLVGDLPGEVADWQDRLRLYPHIFQWIFGGRLHVFIVLSVG